MTTIRVEEDARGRYTVVSGRSSVERFTSAWEANTAAMWDLVRAAQRTGDDSHTLKLLFNDDGEPY